ncbi:MAG: hypothetical protein IKS15_04515 [Opitutales bacterium]|nr:hypothetical protein [Opitutales bacterium]
MKIVAWKITPYNLMIFFVRLIMLFPLAVWVLFFSAMFYLFLAIQKVAEFIAEKMDYMSDGALDRVHSRDFARWIIRVFPFAEQKKQKEQPHEKTNS